MGLVAVGGDEDVDEDEDEDEEQQQQVTHPHPSPQLPPLPTDPLLHREFLLLLVDLLRDAPVLRRVWARVDLWGFGRRAGRGRRRG